MQKVKLNTVPAGVKPVVYVSQYDVGRKFQLQLYEGNKDFPIPDGSTVYVRGKKGDLHSLTYSTADKEPVISYDGAIVTVTTTEQMTAAAGTSLCEIVIQSGDNYLGTLNFEMRVERAAFPNDEETSASDLMAYQDMVDRTHASEVAAANSAAEAEETRKKTEALKNEAQTLVDNFNKGALYSKDITIPADAWIGDEAPYYYDIPGLTDDNSVAFDLPTPDVTDEQYYNYCDAALSGGKSNRIYAYGNKPYIDLPIRLTYLKGGEET